MYKKALDAYEKFIAIPGVPLLQHERYAQLLYFTEQYPKALDHIKYVISEDPNNLIMKRLEAYNSFRLENYALGLEQINLFLKAMPEGRHIYQDYTTLGQLSLKEKQPELAIKAFQRAIELDSARATADGLYKEMANAAMSAGMFPEAVTFFEKYLALNPSPDAGDYYLFAQANSSAAAYYIDPENMASVTTPEEIAAYEAAFKSYVQKGDDAYAKVIKLRPNMHIGYMGRANINSFLDNYDGNKTKKVAGYAKPLYEEALVFLMDNNSNGSRNKDIITVYRYLLSYYAAINDMPSVIDYSKKILDMEPNDEQAKSILKLLKVKH
jgi:tetratricopeptide (TPR) repeat protein